MYHEYITNIYLFAYLWSHCISTIYIFSYTERERYGQRNSWKNQGMQHLTCWMSRPLQLLKPELKLQHQRQETGDSGSLLGHGANCVAQTFQPPEMDQLCGWRGPWAAILQQSSIKLQILYGASISFSGGTGTGAWRVMKIILIICHHVIHRMYAVMWLTCTSGMSSARHVPGKGPKGKAFGSSVQGELMIPWPLHGIHPNTKPDFIGVTIWDKGWALPHFLLMTKVEIDPWSS